MIINRTQNQEYPYKGEFYRMEIDKSKPLNEQTAERVSIAVVDCDIQPNNDTMKGSTSLCDYSIFVKFDPKKDKILIKRGDLFEGSQYGLVISGTVHAIYPSQLGGYMVTLATNEI